jgi:hypothetical protein
MCWTKLGLQLAERGAVPLQTWPWMRSPRTAGTKRSLAAKCASLWAAENARTKKNRAKRSPKPWQCVLRRHQRVARKELRTQHLARVARQRVQCLRPSKQVVMNGSGSLRVRHHHVWRHGVNLASRGHLAGFVVVGLLWELSLRPVSQAIRCRCRELIGQLAARGSRNPKVASSILARRVRLVDLWRLANCSRAGVASLFGRQASCALFSVSRSRRRYFFNLWTLLPIPQSSMTSRRSSSGALPREEISIAFCRRAGREAWRFRDRSTCCLQRRAFDASSSEQFE